MASTVIPTQPRHLLRCSEGDRLSGLVVDAFRDTLVVASSAAWVEKCVSHLRSKIYLLLEAMLATICHQVGHRTCLFHFSTCLVPSVTPPQQTQYRQRARKQTPCPTEDVIVAQVEGADHRCAAGCDARAARPVAAVCRDAGRGGHGCGTAGGHQCY